MTICNNCYLEMSKCICQKKKRPVYEIHSDIIKDRDGVVRVITPPYLVSIGDEYPCH